MKKRVLVFNVGSSSIKYSLFEDKEKIMSGVEENLSEKKDFKQASAKIFLTISGKKLDAIAHRIVHGGKQKQTAKIDDKVKNEIKRFSDFAPLHNPNQLFIIEQCEKLPTPQYAVFDTAFYSELPEIAKTYAIPKEVSKKLEIQKYGFHGISHEYVSRGLRGKTISCHLGQGSSITAIRDGNPVETSMGLTPLGGIPMMTRSGDLDPGVVLFLEKKGYKVEELLNNESGLKGLTGFSDFRAILKNLNKEEEKLAFDIFIYQIKKCIGSYIAVLNGLDNLIFTGAIGINVPKLREEICRSFSFIGLELDKTKNNANEEIISSDNSKVKVYVKKTDEELAIAEEVLKII